MSNRSEQSAKWYAQNVVGGMSFRQIADAHNKEHSDDPINPNIIAGAIFRYRKQRGLKPQPTPIKKQG